MSNNDDGSLEFFASETMGLDNSCTNDCDHNKNHNHWNTFYFGELAGSIHDRKIENT